MSMRKGMNTCSRVCVFVCACMHAAVNEHSHMLVLVCVRAFYVWVSMCTSVCVCE